MRIRSAKALRCSSVMVRLRLPTALAAFFLPRPAAGGALPSILAPHHAHALVRHHAIAEKKTAPKAGRAAMPGYLNRPSFSSWS